MHPTKTRIVYCRDGKRRGKYPNVKFDFSATAFGLGWFEGRRDGILFCSFNPAVSPSAMKAMRAKIRELRLRRRTEWSLADIAYRINPLLRGWINYYGRYAPSASFYAARCWNASCGPAAVVTNAREARVAAFSC